MVMVTVDMVAVMENGYGIKVVVLRVTKMVMVTVDVVVVMVRLVIVTMILVLWWWWLGYQDGDGPSGHDSGDV